RFEPGFTDQASIFHLLRHLAVVGAALWSISVRTSKVGEVMRLNFAKLSRCLIRSHCVQLMRCTVRFLTGGEGNSSLSGSAETVPTEVPERGMSGEIANHGTVQTVLDCEARSEQLVWEKGSR
ncbi:hypothetical protein Tcan_00795, partial [Toxocara canis]